MTKEADFALRQAFALSPSSLEVVFRYVNLLVTENRPKDALIVAQTCQKVDPENVQVGQLVQQLQRMR